MTFTDGRSTECGIDHLWTIRSSKFAGDKTVTTAKLIDMLSRERYQRRITVPGVSGDFGSAPSIGIDPWLLGVLLGDGGLTGSTPRISCTEKYIIDRVSAALPDGISLTHDSGPDYRLSGIKGKKNPVTSALIALGAYGAASAEKSIPVAVYSVPDRLILMSPALTALIAANAVAGAKVSPRTNGAAPLGVSR